MLLCWVAVLLMLTILDPDGWCEQVIKPGRMCLLLGPPGSGKTTLLKALAGKLQHESTIQVRAGTV